MCTYMDMAMALSFESVEVGGAYVYPVPLPEKRNKPKTLHVQLTPI